MTLSALSLPKLLFCSSSPRPCLGRVLQASYHQASKATVLYKQRQWSRAVRSLWPVFDNPSSYCSAFTHQLDVSPLRIVASASIGKGTFAGFATDMASQSTPVVGDSSVVSVHWLHEHLNDENIKVLDASWYMPNDKRDPLEEFKASHIPRALFFDIDGVVDPTTDLPHMLPSEEAFAAAASALGIQNEDTIVVYDGKGIFSAARVWWMFRVFGHESVVVLDGGLPEWSSSGYKVESSVSEELLSRIQAVSDAVKKTYKGQQVNSLTFKVVFQRHLVWSLEEVKKNIQEKTHQHIDARSKARFDGVAPEPRKGIRGGHVPGSVCVPFGDILKDGRTLMKTEELAKKFNEAGVSLNAPIVTSCGTGVTACVLALALHGLGNKNVAVYDGSWTEWGGIADTPVATTESANPA